MQTRDLHNTAGRQRSGLGIGVIPISDPYVALLQPEAGILANAVPARQKEFAAGRSAARLAMQAAGLQPGAILRGDDRAPIWPTGLTGSITHDDKWAAALVGSLDDWTSFGIDVEPDIPLEPELVSEICTAREMEWLLCQPQDQQLRLAKVIFCAKESAYKCQYPLTKSVLGFDAIEIGLGDHQFTACFVQDVAPFCRGDQLTGGFVLASGRIISFVALAKEAEENPLSFTPRPCLRHETLLKDIGVELHRTLISYRPEHQKEAMRRASL